jgi:hypothetical protein
MAKKKASSKPNKNKNEPELPSLALVFGYIAVKELQRIEDRVALLSRLGYGNPEIAAICGTTLNTVGVMKSRSKKRKRKGGAR